MKKFAWVTNLLTAVIFTAGFIQLISAPPVVAAGHCKCADGVEIATSCNTDSDCNGTACQQHQSSVSSGGATCVGGSASTTGSNTNAGTTTGSGSTSGQKLENPLGICKGIDDGKACMQRVIGSVIKAVIGLVGSIALLMFVYGGFLWLTSAGNSDKVEQGKNVVIWSTIGLALIFAAYSITTFIISKLAT